MGKKPLKAFQMPAFKQIPESSAACANLMAYATSPAKPTPTGVQSLTPVHLQSDSDLHLRHSGISSPTDAAFHTPAAPAQECPSGTIPCRPNSVFAIDTSWPPPCLHLSHCVFCFLSPLSFPRSSPNQTGPGPCPSALKSARLSTTQPAKSLTIPLTAKVAGPADQRRKSTSHTGLPLNSMHCIGRTVRTHHRHTNTGQISTHIPSPPLKRPAPGTSQSFSNTASSSALLTVFKKRSFLSMRPTASTAPRAQIFSPTSWSLGMIGRCLRPPIRPRRDSGFADALTQRATRCSPSAGAATAVSDTAGTNAGNACGAYRWRRRAALIKPPMQGNRHTANGSVPTANGLRRRR
jgi:hypothetical protein